MNDGVVTIGTELDTKTFDAQIQQVERKLNDMVADYETMSKQKSFNEQSNEAIRLRENIEKLSNKLVELRKKQEQLNDTKTFEGISKSMNKTIHKVTKWGLAIFGIRSAYMAVRNAINTIAGDDEQLKADIDYMKNAVAYALEPIVRVVVGLVKNLLYMIAYIIRLLTGKNIFENANKSLQNSNKEANKLKKTLAGFDEINILNEDGSTGVANAVLPSPDLDLTNLDAWYNKVSQVVDKAVSNWFRLGEEMNTALNNPQWFKNAYGNWGDFVYGIVELFKSMWNLITGLFEELGGAMDVIVGIFNGDTEQIRQGLHYFVEGAKNVLSGLYTFIRSIFSLIKGYISGVINTLFDITKRVIKGIVNAIGTALNPLIRAINKIGFDVPDWVPVIGGKRWGFNIPEIPHFELAKGGIINMPGRGVPLAGAIGGERGAEGVIPLTDSQQMALLGEAIGKYITINATITNTMNGRVISRELQKINNESNFAYNR